MIKTNTLLHRPLRLRGRQAGVGLIEVLVAVLVLSIGFLGIAALQARSLSMNNSSMARSVATIDSYSILDAMRADLASAQGGAYNKTGDDTIKANACPTDASTLANVQISQWCGQLAQNLGASASTTGEINCTGAGDCTITVTFDDSKSKSAAADTSGMQTVITRAML